MLTDFDFAMKHRGAFNVYSKALGLDANPYEKSLTNRFRKAVEKQLKAIRKARPPRSKPKTYALIGKSKVEERKVVPSSSLDSYAIRDVVRPQRGNHINVDSSGFFL